MKFHLLNLKWPIFADTMIFKYPVGVGRTPHRDPMPAKRKDWRHYRLNFVYWMSKKGGDFNMLEGKPIFQWWRFVLFRPDLYLHEVTPVEEGTRYILSIGWSLPPKKEPEAVTLPG